MGAAATKAPATNATITEAATTARSTSSEVTATPTQAPAVHHGTPPPTHDQAGMIFGLVCGCVVLILVAGYVYVVWRYPRGYFASLLGRCWWPKMELQSVTNCGKYTKAERESVKARSTKCSVLTKMQREEVHSNKCNAYDPERADGQTQVEPEVERVECQKTVDCSSSHAQGPSREMNVTL